MPWLIMLLASQLGCGEPKVIRYSNGLFQLASGFSAKEVCSCVFVGGHDEAFCEERTRVNPDVASFKVDYEARTVVARSLGLGRQKAVFQGEGLGCTLVER